MESSSSMPGVSPAQNLRQGQQAVLDHFKQNWNTVAQLPTGYGKTLAGAACYKAAREAGKANRLLWIVPRRAQADQAAESVPVDLEVGLGVKGLLRERLGASKATTWDISTNQVQALKAHRMGTCEIFVVTVQSLIVPTTIGFLNDMMQTGRWMVVVDEHHHYGDIERSKWGQAISQLSATCQLAMSATPDRSDGASFFPKPDIIVSYADAANKLAVKMLHLNVYAYTLDVIVDGEIIQYTCDQLIEVLGAKTDNPADIEARISERKMRWAPKYVSPLIRNPIERLDSLSLNGIRGQMLVQAMCCSHAEVLCEQIRALLPDGMHVDWVGTGPNGRRDDERVAILNAFCPPKGPDGRRDWTLDVLVNVGIAGEGLDTVDVCEVVFCTRPSKNPSTLQTIGRAARLMATPLGKKQPLAHINVDLVSELREYVGYRIMSAFDGDTPDDADYDEKTERDPSADEYQPSPDEPDVFVANVELTDIFQDPTFIKSLNLYKEMPIFQDTDEHRSALMAHLEEIVRNVNSDRSRPANGKVEHALAKERVTRLTNKIASLVIRIGSNGLRVDKTQSGDIIKRINSRRKRMVGCSVPNSTTEQLIEHYHWNIALERELLAKSELPSWLA